MRSVAVLTALALLVTTAGSSAQVSQDGVLRVQPTAPPDQLALVAALKYWGEQYAAAPHDLKREQVRMQRALALCDMRLAAASGSGGDPSLIKGWVGRLRSITEIPLIGVYEVRIDLVGSHGAGLNLDVPKKSPHVGVLVDMKPRAFVEVDGRFISDKRNNCLSDASLTEAGMMRAPELKLDVLAIRPR